MACRPARHEENKKNKRKKPLLMEQFVVLPLFVATTNWPLRPP